MGSTRNDLPGDVVLGVALFRSNWKRISSFHVPQRIRCRQIRALKV